MKTINFTNLMWCDSEDFFKGKIQRKTGCILCPVVGFSFNEMKNYDDLPYGWIIKVSTPSNSPDPKIHFKTYESGLALYNKLVSIMASSDESVVTIDALAEGAM